MKIGRTLSYLTWVSMLVSLVAAAEKNPVKEDMAALQGEWKMISGSADGNPMPASMLNQMKRICQGNEVTITMAGRTFFKAKVTIDPAKKPKTIDYEMIEGPTKGKKQFGIYELEGGTFKSCFGAVGAERPTEYKSAPGDGRTLSVWKRKEE